MTVRRQFCLLRNQRNILGRDWMLISYWNKFLTENLTKDPGYEQIEQGLMIRLLQYLCQAYVPQLHTDSKEGKEKAFLYELECYIRTNAPTMTVAGADDTSGEADRTAGGI